MQEELQTYELMVGPTPHRIRALNPDFNIDGRVSQRSRPLSSMSSTALHIPPPGLAVTYDIACSCPLCRQGDTPSTLASMPDLDDEDDDDDDYEEEEHDDEDRDDEDDEDDYRAFRLRMHQKKSAARPATLAKQAKKVRK